MANSSIESMYCIFSDKCHISEFDVQYIELFRVMSFDVLYIESSMFCIFRDRCMRPDFLSAVVNS